MSYLPPNPYASLPPAFPPQGGLGGQQPSGFPAAASQFGAPGGLPGAQADPMAALQGLQGGGFPGAQADPMAALQGLQGGGFPGAAGMGQDTFAPQSGAAPQGAQPPTAQGQPQAGVFQHQSGGFADKNTTLSSGGGFWASWKGISTIAGGVATTAWVLSGAIRGKWNPLSGAFWKFGASFGSKAMNAAEGETQKNLQGFTDQIKKNYKTLKDGLTKENADTKHGEFKKYVDEFWTDDMKKEFDEDSFKAYDAVRKAHTEKADAIRDAVKADKKPDQLDNAKELDDAISSAETTYTDKLKKPATETTPPETNTTTTEAEAEAKKIVRGHYDNLPKATSKLTSEDLKKEVEQVKADQTKVEELVKPIKDEADKDFNPVLTKAEAALTEEQKKDTNNPVEAFKTAYNKLFKTVKSEVKGQPATYGIAGQDKTHQDAFAAALQKLETHFPQS